MCKQLRRERVDGGFAMGMHVASEKSVTARSVSVAMGCNQQTATKRPPDTSLTELTNEVILIRPFRWYRVCQFIREQRSFRDPRPERSPSAQIAKDWHCATSRTVALDDAAVTVTLRTDTDQCCACDRFAKVTS